MTICGIYVTFFLRLGNTVGYPKCYKKNLPKSCNIWELCSEMLQKCNISEHGHVFWNISEQRHSFCNISEHWLLNPQFRRKLLFKLSISLNKQHLNVNKYELQLISTVICIVRVSSTNVLFFLKFIGKKDQI